MYKCPECYSENISVDKDYQVGWRLRADRCYCIECCNEWLENEQPVEDKEEDWG